MGFLQIKNVLEIAIISFGICGYSSPFCCLAMVLRFLTIAHKAWGYNCPLCCPGGCRFVGVPQHKPVHGFSPNFQDLFTPRGSRAD